MAKKLTGAKGTAWKAFAQWIRVKGCIETTDYAFAGVCITCGKKFHISYLDAGHCFPGRSNAQLFHEQLVNPQCKTCNLFDGGHATKYREIMDEKYGVEQVDKWKAEGEKPIPDKDMDFEEIKVKYRAKITELLIPFGYNNYEELKRGSSW